MQPREWYRVANQTEDPSVCDIHIVDFIGDWIDDYWGFGVTAKAFIDQLSKLPENTKTVRVHLNTPGGDVFAAVNMANALRALSAKNIAVETVVDGLCASAGTIVMMAGTVVRIADNAMVMVHNPWTIAAGNAAEMRKKADTLDAIRNTIVATYKWHSELGDEALIALMDAETWMDADEAIANGFATEKVEGLKAAASLEPHMLAKLTIPAKFKARVEALLKPETPAPAIASATEILTAVEAAGLDTAFARELVAAALPLDQATARIDTAKAAKVARDTRATDIRAACVQAKQPELADGYISGGMTVAAVKAHLLTITAKLDRVTIDGGLDPDRGTTPKAKINVSAVYAERNSTKK